MKLFFQNRKGARAFASKNPVNYKLTDNGTYATTGKRWAVDINKKAALKNAA